MERLAARISSMLALVLALAVVGLANADEAGSSSAADAATSKARVRLFDFDADESQWLVVNDGVMGGVSRSSWTSRAGVATFAGRVRLENNGGFASTRSVAVERRAPTAATSFLVRMRGDGSTYRFTVDTPRGWYWATLTPPRSTWSDIVVPFSAFKPYTRRGEPDIREPFDADTEMVSVGLLVYNKRAERFTVSLDWLDIV